MAKKKMDDMTADAAAEFLRSRGADPMEFAEAAGIDKLTAAQISDIAQRATAGDPDARKIAEALVRQGRLTSTATPVGREFKLMMAEPMTAVVTKPMVGSPATAGEQVEAQRALEQTKAKKRMDAAPREPIEPLERPAQEAQKKSLVESAKREKTAQASKGLEGIARKPGPAAEIVEGKVSQVGPEKDRLAALRGRNMKAEFSKLSSGAKEKFLVEQFGERVLKLDAATRQRLGELAFAKESFARTNLQSIPDMDDAVKTIDNLAERIKNSADVKGIENAVSNTHKRVLTGQGGKIRGNLLEFRKPKPGQVGSDKPAPVSPVQQASPGFETAKKVDVPPEAKNAKGKKSMDGAPLGEAAAVATDVAAEAVAEAAAAPAAVAAAADTEAAARSKKYKAATEADPKKYGAGSGLKASSSWTPEQKAARAELRKTLGYPDKFVPRTKGEAKAPAATPATPATAEAPAATAAPKAKRITMTDEEKKAWGAAVRADKTKYGTSPKKATAAQKAARNDLAAKIIAGRKAAPAAAAAPVAGAAAAVPATTAAVPAAAAVTTPAATAPAAAASAVPAATAPAAVAAASELPNPYGAKGKGPWKPNPARDTAMLKDRAKKMGIKGAKGIGKAAGVMRFLGPLAAAYGGYELLNLLKSGTIDEADERRLKAIQALGAVSGGMAQDQQAKEQIRGMQRMVDLAAIQRQQALDQMQNQYTGNQALDALLRGQQASLNALAQPSRPSIAEMMARM